MTVKLRRRLFLALLVVISITSLTSIKAFADTPVTLFQSYAGNINFVGTQSTRRTQSNTGNSCAVLAPNTTNSAVITGIPAGATIRVAYLYWAGSGSTPDYSVTFEGTTITAPVARRYTANYTSGPYNLNFFSGVADVTTQVNSKRNGSYSFSGLIVDTGGQHCSVSSVMAGWSLIIVFENASENFRVVNFYEGFQAFRGQSLQINLGNFIVPNTPINGKLAHITWEGDVGNSATLNGVSERLQFNGNTLTDANNPNNNQFNSVSTIESTAPSTGATDNASYGIDFDVYNIDAYLNAGDTSATSTYSSGGDLVILSSEIISVTNTEVSDLSISKTHVGNFNVGQNGTYNIAINNNGPRADPGPIIVTDTLPAGLSYVSATGTGWNCNAVGQDITCTHTGNLASGASAPPLALTVNISASAAPSVTNTATVSGTNFDNISGNNSNNDIATVTSNPSISLQKTAAILSDPVNGTSNPKAIPGAITEYTLAAINLGAGATDNNSIVLTDAIPANTALYVNDISGAGSGPVRFVDGTPASGLSYNFINLSSTIDNVSFSNDGGATYTYTPSPDASGVDTSVTHIKMATTGSFLASSGTGNPNFQFKFRVKVQ